MKNLKKVLSIAFMLMFVVGFIPAQATEKTGSITINNNPTNTGTIMKDHTYSIYRVFNLTLDEGETEEKNKYSYTLTEEFKKFFDDKRNIATDKKDSLNEFAKAYITKENKTTVAKELMDYVNSKYKIPAVKTTAKEDVIIAEDKTESLTVTGVNLGYYLIIDKGVSGTESHVIAAASMGSTKPGLNITLKGEGPSIDKDIKHNEDGSWENVGDNQIGDEVEYRFISTVPNIEGYTNYKYIIHDKMTKGLTFNNDIEIYVGEKDKDGVLLDEANYTVNTTPTDGHTFDIDINVMKMINENIAKKGDKLYIYFSATLNENALVAGDSNDNTVKLEHSNNQYDEDSTTTTPEVIVKDYTFKLNALKTKEDGTTALEGAEFEIRKGEAPLYFTKVGDTYTVCAEKHNHTAVKICAKTIVSGKDGRFHIVGLDDAIEYTIVETKAPDGYNPIKPIKFTITATYVDGKITSIETNVDGIKQVDKNTIELGTTIVNTTDSVLPETGGIGTTIFTVVGGVMMLLAGGLLIKRRRQAS